jgi:hypothetical protein
MVLVRGGKFSFYLLHCVKSFSFKYSVGKDMQFLVILYFVWWLKELQNVYGFMCLADSFIVYICIP